jgi:hypothetical protein
MNGVSKNWTNWAIFREALTDLGWVENSELHMQSEIILTRAVQDVLPQIFPAVMPAYRTSDAILASPSANYSTSGTGTWVAATRTLTFAGIAGPFGSGDIDKLITFVVGGSGHTGTIASVPSTTSVTVSGPNVPATDGTVISLIVLGTRLSSLTASISALSISDLQGSELVLESSSIDQACDPVSVKQLRDFRPSGLANRGRIVFAREGTSLLLRLGLDVATVGTLILHYPRTSYAAVDAEKLDLPDGAPARLGMLRTEAILAKRLNRQVDLKRQMADQIAATFAGAGTPLAANQAEAKAEVLT